MRRKSVSSFASESVSRRSAAFTAVERVPSGSRALRAILIAGADLDDAASSAPGAGDSLKVMTADLQVRFGAGDAVIEPLAMPTRRQVMTAFASMRRITRSGDLFVVMFAGHGKGADRVQRSQSWWLRAGELFDDIELANHLRRFRRGVDIVVISDCCYGEGLFRAGQSARRLTRKVFGRNRRRRLRDSAMVCISAASEAGEVKLAKLVDLVRDTVAAAVAGHTYEQLAQAFKAQRTAGRDFHVDARPPGRLCDRVLATERAPLAPSGAPGLSPPGPGHRPRRVRRHLAASRGSR
jgi:hypothetical protein